MRTLDRAPYVFDAVPVAAVHSAAGAVSREWGDDGYRIVTTRHVTGSNAQAAGMAELACYVFGVRCSGDGSEFHICADRYGNVYAAEWDGETQCFTRGERI